MDLNSTPSANRVNIAFFGCRNAGKSSLVNAVTGQELSVVSEALGTTTDPVSKAMELLPLGPVVIIDTPGFDDSGELGEKRVKKTRETLNRADIAVLVADGTQGLNDCDRELLRLFKEKQLPYIIVYSKSDLCASPLPETADSISVSAKNGANITALKEKLAHLAPEGSGRRIIGDLLRAGDVAVLVTPIDEAAPKGRMILPQVQTIRDVLDAGAMSVVCRETELEQTLRSLAKAPAVVVTDSQAFAFVSQVVPQDVPLTSFSILMARYKGFLDNAVKGTRALETLSGGDTVLIAEGCTHHRQCSDIGTVKLPRWINGFTGKELRYKFCSGREFPEDLTGCAAVVHCGGCMLGEREVLHRMRSTLEQGVPFTNYGTLIAHINGILSRSVDCIAALEQRARA